eukprot:gene12955-biopygen6084
MIPECGIRIPWHYKGGGYVAWELRAVTAVLAAMLRRLRAQRRPFDEDAPPAAVQQQVRDNWGEKKSGRTQARRSQGELRQEEVRDN